MPIVLRLPQGVYQFLILQTIVYWTIVAGHAASGYGFLVGIPLLPLLVIQIALLCHVWTSVFVKNFRSPASSRSHSTTPETSGAKTPPKSRSSSEDFPNDYVIPHEEYMLISQFGDDMITSDLDA